MMKINFPFIGIILSLGFMSCAEDPSRPLSAGERKNLDSLLSHHQKAWKSHYDSICTVYTDSLIAHYFDSILHAEYESIKKFD